MNKLEQQEFLNFAESIGVSGSDCVDLEEDTLKEAKAKISGLSAAADHFQKLVQKEHPSFGR